MPIRPRLEAVLGTPTIAVQSGGLWTDQATGELCPKQHVHWRLTRPTRTPIEHDFLREVRKLATTIAGGDASAVPMVHPLRWAGSVHRKDKPRLARIIAYNPEIEITLAAALGRLRAAADAQPAADLSFPPHRPGNSGQADALDVAAALAVLANDDLDWEQWNTIGLACWRATGGSEAGYAAFAAWSSKSAKFDPRTTRTRWDHFATSPPDRIGAGEPAADDVAGMLEALPGDGGEDDGADGGGGSGSRLDAMIDEMNRRFALANEAGRAMIYQPAFDWVLRRQILLRLRTADLKTMFANRLLTVTVQGTYGPIAMTKSWAEWWLKHPRRRQYLGGVVCDPSRQVPRDLLEPLQRPGRHPRAGEMGSNAAAYRGGDLRQ
jgi:hypothetical protein